MHPQQTGKGFLRRFEIVTSLAREAEGERKNPGRVVDSYGGLHPVPAAAGHDPTCSLPGRHVELAYGILWNQKGDLQGAKAIPRQG